MTPIKKSLNRKFCTLPEDSPLKVPKYRSSALSRNVDCPKLIKYIDDNVIGKNTSFLGPFGRRKIVYCDYTASGRGLQFIEDYILKEVLPLYGNTHTSTNVTAVQSTLFRHEARDIIRNAAHASEDDAVIFAGHGCTGAIHKLIHALELKNTPPVILVGSSEHHSVLLPWREIGSKVIRIAETRDGFLDLVDLENKLSKLRFPNGTRVIGCFSAASNITGILADDIATTILLHQYGALAFWDYATAAPYVTFNMNPILPGNDKAAYKDAIFFSGHKFIGGVQSPGVLIAKKSLFQNEAPEGCGGGSVFFVSRNGHRYLQDIEMREEGGTAAIVECVRLGLSVHLKQTVGEVNIQSREEKLTKTVLTFLRSMPEIILLGNGSRKIKRLAVFSFMVKHPRAMFLHHNFVCSILNDIFGIQARGGCACAGPYAHDLLGIDEELTDEYENALVEDSRLDRHHLRRKEEYSQYEILRPGFTRISLPYFISDPDLTFILEAIKLVATEGWKLLPQYVLNPETAEWKHRNNTVYRDRKWLGSIKYTDGKMVINDRKISGLSPFPQDNQDCLQTAKSIFNRARRIAQKNPLPDQTLIFDGKTEKLRWFLLPSEAHDLLLGTGKNVKTSAPFDPHYLHLSYIYRANGNRLNNDVVTPDEECEKLTKKSELLPRHNSLSVLDAINELPRLETSSYSDCGTPLLSVVDISPSSECSSSAGGGDRLRCRTLESPNRSSSSSVSKKILSSPVYRQCSCGSQTDVSDSDSKDGLSGDYSEIGDMDINNLFPQSESEHIQAYVKGVTEELATEIKSEIRGVIATVDDALSESMESLEISSQYSDKRFSVDSRLSAISSSARFPSSTSSSLINRNNSVPAVMSKYYHRSSADIYSLAKELSDKDLSSSFRGSSRKRISSCNGSINGSVVENGNSAAESPSSCVGDQVAFYLAELTSEMVTEMKSEFREMVNAVDEIISPSVSSNSDNKTAIIKKSSGKIISKKSVAANDSDNIMEGKVVDDGIRNEEIPTSRVSTCGGKIEVDILDNCDDDIKLPNRTGSISEEETTSTNVIGSSDKANENCNNAVQDENRISDSSNDSGLGYNDANKKSDDSEDNDQIDGLNRTDGVVQAPKPGIGRTRKISLLKEPKFNMETDYTGPVHHYHDPSSCSSLEKRKRSFECVSINPKWHCPPKSIWKPMLDVIREFDMIREGDRVLVCLSGGKDSLSLLHSLHQYQYYAISNAINFTLGAVTVDPGSPAYDPRPLIPYLHALGVHYLYEEQKIMEKAEEVNASSICSFCSRLKRGRLYKAARANNYNVLALGQHLDDSAESFLMSVFHNARLRTMKAHYYISNRDLRVIRPFIYVREKYLRQFAENRKLPVIAENCPACFEAPKERHRMKQLLAQQEILHPRLFANVKSAIHPLISVHYTGVEKQLYSKSSPGKSSSSVSAKKSVTGNGAVVEDDDDDDYYETEEDDPPTP